MFHEGTFGTRHVYRDRPCSGIFCDVAEMLKTMSLKPRATKRLSWVPHVYEKLFKKKDEIVPHLEGYIGYQGL